MPGPQGRQPGSTQRRPATLRWLLALAVCIVPASGDEPSPGGRAGSATSRPAPKVAVVLSCEAAPYREAEKRLTAELTRAGLAARTMLLADLAADRGVEVPDVDAVVAVGTEAAVQLHAAVKGATRLVYCMVSDAEAAGLTRDPPAWGVSVNVPLEAQFALIAEAIPPARTVGMLYRSDSPAGRRLLEAAGKALPREWRLEAIAVDQHDSEARAICALLARGVDVVWTAPDASVYNVATVRSLLLGAMRRGVPVFGFSCAFVRAGALLGVAIDPAEQGRHAAEMTLGLLKDGAAPADAPPAKDEPVRRLAHPRYEIAVNLIVAEKLSVDLPEKLLRRARHRFGAETPGSGRARSDPRAGR